MKLSLLLLCLINLLISLNANERVLYKEGQVSLTSKEGRLKILTDQQGFLIYKLSDQSMFKLASNANLEARYNQVLNQYLLTLVDGELLLNLPAKDSTLHVVETPYGEFSAKKGDFLFKLDFKKQVLEIACSDGLATFKTDNLEYSLRPGEKLSLYQDKIYPKEILKGFENRYFHAFYKRGHAWPEPAYFYELASDQSEIEPEILELYIQGVPVSDNLNNLVLSVGDLILGAIRIEGKVLNKLAYQNLEISLNGGASYFDLGNSNKFTFKVDPLETNYKLSFRLIDNQRILPINYPQISFSFIKDLGENSLKNWLKDYKRAYERADAISLRNLLKDTQSYSLSIYEDIIKELSQASIRRINFEVIKFIIRGKLLVAEVKFLKFSAQKHALAPIKEEGIWQLTFRQNNGGQLSLLASANQDPLLVLKTAKSADRIGPRVFASQRLNVDKSLGANLAIVIEDDKSTIKRIEYFLDRVGSPGVGTNINCDDGFCDEKRESASLRIPGQIKAKKVYIRAQDSAGNWGNIHSVILSPI